MIRKLMTVTLITALVGIAAPSFAQTDIIELLRSDIVTQKKAIITEAMAMTEEQSSIFWPIYNDYQDELRKVGDARVAVITEYAANYDAMTDEMANDLSKRALKAQDDRLGLYKKYHGKFAKAMSPIMAGRWLQTEAAINTMIDVQIASEMPLMH
jgi:hypothetical protein